RALRVYLIAAVAITIPLAPGAAWAQQTSVTYSYNGFPLAIMPNYRDFINIADVGVSQGVKITKVNARVQLQHPNSGDLRRYLVPPEGTRTILLEHDCGVANVDTTFDDAAQSAWKDFCPVEAGRGPFRADQPLANFNGDFSSFGVWRLAMENDRSDS